MQSEWTRVQIGELVAAGHASLQTGPFGSQLHKHDYVARGVAIVPTEAIGRGAIRSGAVLPQVSPAKALELRRHKLRRGDILFARRGAQATGLSAVVEQELEGALCGTGAILLRVDHDCIDPYFLAAVLATDESYEWLRAHAVGAVMPNLNTGVISQLTVPRPSLNEQRAIASTIQSLSGRIDLLRQTNATLESIAQALFKSWFIDFDPVRAKGEGREPESMDAATAALFPAEFEESALGLIPKGWRIGTVEDLFVLQRGFDLPASQRTDGPFVVFAASGPHGHHHEPMVRGPGVVTGRSGVIGRVFFSHEDFWPLNTSLWVKQFKTATAPYAYQYLQTMDLSRLNAGSAVPTLNRNHVHAQSAVVPRSELVDAYTAVAMPLLQRIRGNETNSAVLTELRDALLPRLISGKLRLPEAEEQVEAALA